MKESDTSEIFKFKVDYNRTLPEMIADGKYGWASRIITPETYPYDRSLGAFEIEAEYVYYHKREFHTGRITDAMLDDFKSPKNLKTMTTAEFADDWSNHRCEFYKSVGTDMVYADLDQRDLRPMNLVELLAFGAAHPEQQRKYKIVALGSVYVRRNNYVAFEGFPCLDRGEDGRILTTSSGPAEGWHYNCRFPIIRSARALSPSS